MVYFIFCNNPVDGPLLCVGEWYDEEDVKAVVKDCNTHHPSITRAYSSYYYVGVSEDEL